MQDERELFDVALMPGKRARLSAVYTELRRTEAHLNGRIKALNEKAPENFIRVARCPVCGADTENASEWLTVDGMPIVRCADCGMMYGANILEAVHDQERYTEDTLENMYITLKSNPEYESLETAKCRYVVNSIAKHVAPSEGAFLDIGASTGALVKQAKVAGWQAFGVEASAKQCDYAQDAGLQVMKGHFPEVTREFSDAQFPGKFSVISAFDILEHMTDPGDFLSYVDKILSDNGVLAIQVPNVDSLLVRLEGADNSSVCLGHWSYFSGKTLSHLLEKFGYRTVMLETYISELDRIISFPESRIETTLEGLLGERCLASDLSAAWLHENMLGYKLFGIFERA